MYFYVSTHSRPKAAGKNPAIRAVDFTFQLTAARRRLVNQYGVTLAAIMFQLTAARRRLVAKSPAHYRAAKVSTHSRPKAAGRPLLANESEYSVSTHSRPKAAGNLYEYPLTPSGSFNSQPPEGGWTLDVCMLGHEIAFQLTAARRRLDQARGVRVGRLQVSTHSRPKAAGYCLRYLHH